LVIALLLEGLFIYGEGLSDISRKVGEVQPNSNLVTNPVIVVFV
jgi:hypothetical protein